MATLGSSQVTREADGASREPRSTVVRAFESGLQGNGVADLLLQRMAGIVLSSGVGVVRGRIAGGPRWANDAFLAMSGYARTDLAGLDWAALTPVQAIDFLTVGPDGIAPTTEHEFVHKDGSRWPVIVSRGTDPSDPTQLILFVVDLTASRTAEASRRAADARYARFFELSNVVFWTADATGRGRLSGAATGAELLLGGATDDVTAQSSLVHADERAYAATAWERALATGSAYDIEVRTRQPGSDDYRWTRLQAFPDSVDGKVVGWYGTSEDVHDRRLDANSLSEVQQRLSRALDGTGVGVWEWDGATDVISMSGGVLGMARDPGSSDASRRIDYPGGVHHDDIERLQVAMADCIAGRSNEFTAEVRVRRDDGRWIWVLDRGLATARDADGQATRLVGTLTNIDESKCAAERLRWTVEHDTLTGLASRTLFNSRLEAALSRRCPVALALLDIDDFKSVNDVFGHAAGDALLVVLAQRLTDFAYPGETVARLGGDEFTLIMPDCGSAGQVTRRLDALRAALAEPFVHEGQALTCRSSIGVAIAPAHGGDPSTLLRSADIAMYTAKASSVGGVALYDPALGAKVRGEAAATADIRAALDTCGITTVYEPVVRLSSGQIAGYEAHAHIIGGNGTPIDVYAFEANFRDSELAVQLGSCIVDHVLADFAAWRAAGVAPEFVSVNVSRAELRQPDYAERLLAKLAAHAIDSSQLRIEIVESGLQPGRAGESSEATLTALRQGGLRAGLDRFGAGASSLSHLSRLPLAAVKIDGQFMQGVAEPGSDQTIVRAIAGLAASFGLRVVAVGVETEAQAAVLAQLGCTYGQGPWFGAPRNGAAVLRGISEA